MGLQAHEAKHSSPTALAAGLSLRPYNRAIACTDLLTDLALIFPRRRRKACQPRASAWGIETPNTIPEPRRGGARQRKRSDLLSRDHPASV
jgi:hypothetical protein